MYQSFERYNGFKRVINCSVRSQLVRRTDPLLFHFRLPYLPLLPRWSSNGISDPEHHELYHVTSRTHK